MNIVEELRALVGHNGVMEAADVATRSAGAYRPDNLKAMALVRPANTDEVAAVMRWCHAHGVRVVTQGGLTGLVHGGDANADELILSLERMRTIEDINPVQRTATVQAGVTLQALQEAVEAHDLAYPLDLGARGTATLGGTAATNAGGNRVIRYGMTRDMVLGLGRFRESSTDNNPADGCTMDGIDCTACDESNGSGCSTAMSSDARLEVLTGMYDGNNSDLVTWNNFTAGTTVPANRRCSYVLTLPQTGWAGFANGFE